MSNNIDYIAKYQKANTIQVVIRLNKKYDADIIEKLNSLPIGKTTYIKKLIRKDLGIECEVEEDDAMQSEEVKNDAEQGLSIAQVCRIVGVSEPTISNWYRWKKERPEEELTELLPNFFRVGPHRERRWHESDVEKLIKFRNSIPQGRNGIMGSVTQRYYKNSRWNKGNAA